MPTFLESQLHVGWYLSWQQQTYHILRVDQAALQLQAVHAATGERVDFSLQELLAADPPSVFAPTLEALSAHLMHRFSTTPVADIPDTLQQRADQIIAAVEQVERLVSEEHTRAVRYGEAFRRTASLRRALAQLDTPLALPTFYKYRQLYTQHHGQREALALTLHRATFHQTKMSAAQLHFLDTLILRYYARSRPLRPMSLYRLAQSVLQRTQNHWVNPDQCPHEVPAALVEKLFHPQVPIQILLEHPEDAPLLTTITLPSQSWFYAYLRWFEAQPDRGEALITSRHGSAVWEQQHKVFDTFVTQAAYPLQYVFADHWLLDVFTVDAATRSQVNRLWFTVLIDAYSRSILGSALLDEPPCIISIQQALQHAIWPKPLSDGADLTKAWVCFGIPQQLYLDNAWAHHSHSLEDLTRTISQGGKYNSMDLVFRPPYKGRYGALIERFFGNLSGQVKEHLPGAILGSNPRQVRSAASQACLLYHDLERILRQLILTYQHTPHHELNGSTPHEKWLEGLQNSLPLVPPMTPALTRLFWRLEPKPRLLTEKGISAFGLHYWSPEVGGLERIGRSGQRVPYRFRYHPDNISQLALFRDGQWVGDVYAKQLRRPDGSYRPVSLAERHLAQAIARQQGNAPQDWLRFVYDIDQLTRTRLNEKRRAQRASQSDTHEAPEERRPFVSTDTPLLSTVDYTDLLAGFFHDGSSVVGG